MKDKTPYPARGPMDGDPGPTDRDKDRYTKDRPTKDAPKERGKTYAARVDISYVDSTGKNVQVKAGDYVHLTDEEHAAIEGAKGKLDEVKAVPEEPETPPSTPPPV